jgi:hypothetical protein
MSLGRGVERPQTFGGGSAARRSRSERPGDRIDQILLVGEAVASLRSDHLVIHSDLEDPGVALAQCGLDAEFLLERSRRTGGPGKVTSGGAVGDGDHPGES